MAAIFASCFSLVIIVGVGAGTDTTGTIVGGGGTVTGFVILATDGVMTGFGGGSSGSLLQGCVIPGSG